MRIALFCLSAIKKKPSVLIAIPVGPLNEANCFVPSAPPGEPVPAKVITEGVFGGITWLLLFTLVFLLHAEVNNITIKSNV